MMVMMIMSVVIVIVIIVVFVVMMTFDFRNPCGRSCHLLEIELAGIDQFVQVHVAIIALDDLHAGIQGLHNLFHALELLGLDLRRLVQKHYVAELYLLDYQAFKIFLAYVFFLQGVAAGELALHAQGVHHGDYAVQLGIDELLRSQLGHGADGLGDGARLADAAGFDHDVVELVHTAKLGQLGHEVHLERAADAAVLQSDERIVGTAHDATLLDEVGVDVDFAYIIDYHGELDAALVGEYTVQQRCLAASEVTGHEEDRNLFFFQIYCHIVNHSSFYKSTSKSANFVPRIDYICA